MTATIDDVLSGRARWTVLEGDCLSILPTLPPKSVAHVITDPPYSEHVHSKQRRVLKGSGGRVAKGQRSGRGQVVEADLGFVALTPELRRLCGVHFPRIARRWILTFTDLEGQSAWQADLERAGGRHVRVGVWRKLAGQPQLTGDRPAVGCEGIEVAHVRGERLCWNGGGLPAFWEHPAWSPGDIAPVPDYWEHAIATDRNGNSRVHTTQKPLPLMLELVEQFTDPDDVVLDAFAGAGTTGAACVQLGRRFIGIEMDETYAQLARDRIRGWGPALDGRGGQLALLEGT